MQAVFTRSRTLGLSGETQNATVTGVPAYFASGCSTQRFSAMLIRSKSMVRNPEIRN